MNVAELMPCHSTEPGGFGDVRVDFEDFGGGAKEARVLRLIEYLRNRDLLPYLVEAVRRARPGAI